MTHLKIFILYLAKFMGLFRLSRRVTSKGLRIVCYHGFSLDDEHRFRPKLFMSGRLFEQRLRKLSRMKFSVIPLSRAVAMLKAGVAPVNSLVLTIDDGWQGVEDIAWPLLQKYNFDWTLYLTTYYVAKQTQVMNLYLQYILFKTSKKHVDLSALGNSFGVKYPLVTDADRDKLAGDLAGFCATLATAELRQKFVADVAVVLGLNQREIEAKRLFYLLRPDTLKRMAESGVNIQLHTHRHRLRHGSKAEIAQELADNRNIIKQVCARRPTHLCYPSGRYDKSYFPWLAENNVVSASTCKPGLNYADTPLFELNRFLDGQTISAIEFESELSGFSEILRMARARLKGLRPKVALHGFPGMPVRPRMG